ncbi:MAG: radical SAM protein [Thermoplasmata archaeon]
MSSISFVRPSKTISISVTGEECPLNCMHCAGRYLRGMRNAKEIPRIEHAPSYLVTGGCGLDGKVPILECSELLLGLPEGSTKIAHTGLMDEEDAELLSEFIDVISFDFVGDDKTIKEIYGLNKSVDDCLDSFQSVSCHIPTYPHLTIGLYKGEIAGEYEALDILESLGAKSIVLNVFKPTDGTSLGHLPPPGLGDVKNVIKEAREKFADVYLGCMRPGGSYREKLDVLGVEEGCDRIVNPSKQARELASKRGIDTDWKEECCIL